MSDIFDTSQSNFYKNIRLIQKTLTQYNNKSYQLQSLKQSLTQAKQQLKNMQIQCGLCNNDLMRDKIKLFKEEYKNYKKEVQGKEKVMDEEHFSDQLFDHKGEEVGVDPLIQAKRQMYDCEAISGQAAIQIKKNNSRLRKNIDKIDDINNQLTVAQKLLGSIKKKLAKNKYIFYGTLIILVIVLMFVLYSYVK